ncbi:hypothetical protein ECP029943811_5005, partial [Escherichia coli P0299438.11]
MRSAGSVS